MGPRSPYPDDMVMAYPTYLPDAQMTAARAFEASVHEPPYDELPYRRYINGCTVFEDGTLWLRVVDLDKGETSVTLIDPEGRIP
jgi:hypothetical protein